MAATAVRMDEATLIRAAQAGDERAFEELVHLYDQSVLRLALNLLRSPEDANDIYQEAFLRVYKNLHAFRFDCSSLSNCILSCSSLRNSAGGTPLRFSTWPVGAVGALGS